jgi:phosphate-selective porin OprO/OprP
LFKAEGYDVNNVDISGTSTSRVQGNLSQYHNVGNDRFESRASGTTSGAKTYTAGIRWILNPNLVIKGNYSYTKFDNAFGSIDVKDASNDSIQNEKLLMFRTQFMF